jgi:hypothetical protein
MLCAEAPTILRFVTRKAGATVAPQILEKSVTRRLCRSARLKCRDLAARIIINLHLRNDRWRWLGGRRWIRKQAKQPLLINNFAGNGRGVVGPTRADKRDGHYYPGYDNRTDPGWQREPPKQAYLEHYLFPSR